MTPVVAPAPGEAWLQSQGLVRGAPWLHFHAPEGVLQARVPAEVLPCLRAVDAALARGLAAAGWLSYEAAPGLDPAACTHAPRDLPLAWFGLYRKWSPCAGPPWGRPAPVANWTPSITPAEHASAVARIREWLRDGDTYQVNLTLRLRTQQAQDPLGLFRRLVTAHQPRYAGLVATDAHVICSASPELFFRLHGTALESRPMKGTVPRRPDAVSDAAAGGALRRSEKNRAENVMIVDMVRNDMGRVALPGTVGVSRLFHVERYPTVWQMTSTVRAQTAASLAEIMEALFPCASITGAPKLRTMQIIRALEPDPRGAYTGAVGFALPGRRASFNVAIRTAVVERARGTAEYGIGGGIVWDSDAADEYAECLAKAAVLSHETPEFSLLETLRWSPEEGFHLLERHLGRLIASARYFGFRVRERDIRAALTDATVVPSATPLRVRLTVDREGHPQVTVAPAPVAPTVPWRLRLVPDAVRAGDPFVHHKTTHREVYARARLRAGADCDDALLANERGEVTETTIGNVVFERDGQRWTPPARCGLLAGTLRAALLDTGEVREAVLPVEALHPGIRLWVINSVRVWIPAVFAGRA